MVSTQTSGDASTGDASTAKLQEDVAVDRLQGQLAGIMNVLQLDAALDVHSVRSVLVSMPPLNILGQEAAEAAEVAAAVAVVEAEKALPSRHARSKWLSAYVLLFIATQPDPILVPYVFPVPPAPWTEMESLRDWVILDRGGGAAAFRRASFPTSEMR
jgi:hypothetical protein